MQLVRQQNQGCELFGSDPKISKPFGSVGYYKPWGQLGGRAQIPLGSELIIST